MIKIFLTLFLLYLSSIFCPITAQISVGAKAGVNLGSVFGPIEKGSKGKLMLLPILGFDVRYNCTPRLSVQTGVQYSMKGADYFVPQQSDSTIRSIPPVLPLPVKVPYTSYNIDGEMTLHYLEMPLLLSYKMSKKMELIAGMQTAYLLSGKSVNVQDSIVIGNRFLVIYDTIVNTSDQLKRWDWAATLGMSYYLKPQWSIDWRVSSSLQSIFRKELSELRKNFLNVFLQITSTYRIGKKTLPPKNKQKPN